MRLLKVLAMQRSAHEAGTTLLQSPSLDADAGSEVHEILSQSPPAETNLLVISYRQGPDAWLADWQTHVGQLPADLAFIHVGEIARSTATPTTGATTPPFGFVDAVGDPADLTGLGIRVSERLKRWETNDNHTVVCLNSLTALLQFVELNRAYRFLHVLSGRVTSVDGHAYYRFDPDAHDPQTIAILQSLVDTAIEVGHRRGATN